MARKKVTITGEVFKGMGGIGKEMKHQVFGTRPKKKKSGDTINIHYHIYRKKK